ncbi:MULTISPECIES: DNA polymerase III subunit [unclassified Legionella]|uniref:DNA polymerase III subunit n=1 Tax=unclassified Legionella TaxID=2622702 RepID=UPI00105464E6|nr:MULTISPECIES: DNA polymerase III subunit delta' [unclassified Legionella]MDI9818196.1 DNA polymerase III subunit delta' [Legionella sp. PL877]
MQSLKTIELSAVHTKWWERFIQVSTNQRLPHALLLVGSLHVSICDFAYRMAAAILCQGKIKPCEDCKSCRLLRLNEHPDLFVLEPEKTGGFIKIDQVRELQAVAYTSPQLNNNRVIIINPAEKMNLASANALLKLLEEPPSDVIFLLVAEQISSILPTILSRCQQWQLSSTEVLDRGYLTIGECYPKESERGKIFSQHIDIINDLFQLASNKISICSLAIKWAAFDFNQLIWLIYLINSQMIYYQLIHFNYDKDSSELLYELSRYFQPTVLFHQMDELNSIIRKLNQNISINQTLALEALLMGYTK